MKKTWVLALSVGIAAAALTACGGSSTTATTAATTAEESSAAETTAATTEAAATTAAEAAKESSAAAEEAESEEETEEEESTEESEAEKKEAGETVTVKIGASPSPHAEILEFAQDKLLEEGVDLVVVTYNDYVQPNLAVDQGELDANYFQHQPYLDDFNEKNGTHVLSVGKIHYEPFGIYAGKSTDLSDIPDGAQIAVPNDTTNEARALLLLEANGIITLKDGVGLEATKQDIVDNPHNVEILEVEAAQIPRSIDSVDFAAMNGNYALDAGFKASDALAQEASDSEAAQTYGNVVAVKEGREDEPWVKTLVEVLQAPEVRSFIESEYEGAVVPMD